VLVIMIKY